MSVPLGTQPEGVSYLKARITAKSTRELQTFRRYATNAQWQDLVELPESTGGLADSVTFCIDSLFSIKTAFNPSNGSTPGRSSARRVCK